MSKCERQGVHYEVSISQINKNNAYYQNKTEENRNNIARQLARNVYDADKPWRLVQINHGDNDEQEEQD